MRVAGETKPYFLIKKVTNEEEVVSHDAVYIVVYTLQHIFKTDVVPNIDHTL